MTGVTASEFCRRAINLALFADTESATRAAVWKSQTPEQREKYLVDLFGPEQYDSDDAERAGVHLDSEVIVPSQVSTLP